MLCFTSGVEREGRVWEPYTKWRWYGLQGFCFIHSVLHSRQYSVTSTSCTVRRQVRCCSVCARAGWHFHYIPSSTAWGHSGKKNTAGSIGVTLVSPNTAPHEGPFTSSGLLSTQLGAQLTERGVPWALLNRNEPAQGVGEINRPNSHPENGQEWHFLSGGAQEIRPNFFRKGPSDSCSLSNPEVTRSVLREGEGECACSPAGAARDPQECQGCLTEVTK